MLLRWRGIWLATFTGCNVTGPRPFAPQPSIIFFNDIRIRRLSPKHNTCAVLLAHFQLPTFTSTFASTTTLSRSFSKSVEVDKQMVSRIRIELGNSFTTKLEAMCKDITLSEDISNGYRNYVTNLGDAEPKRT